MMRMMRMRLSVGSTTRVVCASLLLATCLLGTLPSANALFNPTPSPRSSSFSRTVSRKVTPSGTSTTVTGSTIPQFSCPSGDPGFTWVGTPIEPSFPVAIINACCYACVADSNCVAWSFGPKPPTPSPFLLGGGGHHHHHDDDDDDDGPPPLSQCTLFKAIIKKDPADGFVAGLK